MVILLDSSKITMIYTRADLGWFSRTVAKNRPQSVSFHTAVEYPGRKWSVHLAWLYATKSWSYHHCAQLIKAFYLIIRFNLIHVLTLA